MKNKYKSLIVIAQNAKVRLLVIVLVALTVCFQTFANNYNLVDSILDWKPLKQLKEGRSNLNVVGLMPTELLSSYGRQGVKQNESASGIAENPCGGISLLPCEQIGIRLPLDLQFSGADGGLANTGFTMALPHSASRLTEDQPVTNANVIGFEPLKLSIATGKLGITSSRGIMFRDPSSSPNTNTQVNALGVGIPANQMQRITTTLVNPFAGVAAGDNGSQQAGIWYGIDDNNYIKLVLVKNNSSAAVRAQLMVESYGSSSTGPTPVEINSADIADPRSKNVTLTLEFDAVAGRVLGYYQVDNGVKTIVSSTVGNSIPVSQFIRAGIDHDSIPATDNIAFTGVFGTYRNSTIPVDFQFDNFSIQDLSQPVAVPFRINAGGPQRTSGENVFVADAHYSPAPGEVGNSNYGLVGIVTPELYYDRRFGANMSYNIPIANGSYAVRLHMVENFHTSAGARMFDVDIEGVKALDDIDLFVEGKNQNKQLIVKDVNTAVSDGTLNIVFQSSKDKAIVNAIEILPAAEVSNRAPVFDQTIYSYSVEETLPLNSVIGSATATDADGDEITYALTAGNEENKFSISASGQVTVAAALSPGLYELTVSASDKELTATASVNINVIAADAENIAPVAMGDAAEAYHGTPLLIDVLANDTDADGTLDPASIVIVEQPGQGSAEAEASGKIAYTPATLGTYTFSYTVADNRGAVSEPATVTVNTGVKVNFQDMASVPPAGYLKDYGQGFGPRTEAYQGTGLSYGWKDLSGLNDGPLNLTGNGRNRLNATDYGNASPEEKLRATLLHMQANHVSGTFNGNPTEGVWVMQVPNGRYRVAVGVGDPTVDGATADIPKHSINVEGVAAIINYVPVGTTFNNSGPRHSAYSVVVDVADNMLTIDAFGGHNTKINSVVVTPSSDQAAGSLAFEPGTLEFEATTGSTSVNSTVALKATPVASGTAPKLFATPPSWLAIPEGAFGELSFTASPGSLPAGTYTTEVTARAVGYSSAQLPVVLNLSEGKSSETSFSAFALAGATGAINSADHSISVAVASTADLTSLVADFSLSAGATAKVGDVLQVSGETVNDFTNPVTYVVTAEDGITTQEWVVNASKTTIVNTAPVFDGAPYSFSTSQTAGIGTEVGVVAALDNEGDELTFAITGGNTNNAFALNSLTGAVTVNKALNYHTQSTYSLALKVTDKEGLSDETTIAISVGAGLAIPAFPAITWSNGASQPYSVSEAQGRVVNGKLYSFGGFDSQKACCTPTARAYVFNPATNTWSPIASMPPMNGTSFGGVTHAGITTDGTDIYFAGGYTSNSAGTGQIFGTKEVWKYIVSENRYIRLPDLPIAISAGQLEYLNGRLHHISGTNTARTQDLGDHYVLDLDNESAGWKSLAALPNPRQHAGSVVFEGKIYFVGGQTGHDSNLTTKKEVHRYNPESDSWTRVADLPVPVGANGRGHISSSVVVVGNRIIVLGGETAHSTGRTNMVSAYSPATDVWENLTPLPLARFSGVAALLDGNVYYTGGSSSNTTYKGIPTNTTEPNLACSPISTLPCDEIAVTLPFSLEFTGSEGKLANTGFTMVDAYTGTRNTSDGSASSTVIGFEPSKLSFENGALKFVTNKGIAFLANNNQINSLGVKFDASKKFSLEATVINPFNGTGSQQAGVWFGLNDKTFVKLVVTGNRVELRRELNDTSSTAQPASNPDQRITPTISGLDNQTVRLRLVVDPTTQTAEAFYSTDGITFINVGEGYTDKSVSLSRMGVTVEGAYAGIQATHRNGSSPVMFTFDNFSITPQTPAANQAPIVAVAPQNQELTAGAAFSFSAGSYSDPDGDALTYTASLADDSALPTWLNFDAANLTFSGTAPGTVTSLSVKVTASDVLGKSTSAPFSVVIKEAGPVVACSPISLLPCQDIRINLKTPYLLDFNGNAGGLSDKTGIGTGFTMVDNPSARLAADGTVYNTSVPGYEPSRLEVASGQLKITTNRGIAYLNPSGSARTNSQINALGVGVNATTQKFNIETTLVNPYVGTKAEQAGLWFGLDEDNYVKLVVNNGTIEMRREVGAVSGQTTADLLNTGTSPIANISTSTVRLRLLIDNAAGTIAGFYSINGGTEIQMGGAGATMSVPGLITGKTVGGIANMSFAGVFATHRNAGDPNFGTLANPPVYSFDNFKIEAATPVTSLLTFTPSSLSFTATQGATISAQSATLTASEGNPAITLTKSANSDWLVLPAGSLGTLNFNVNMAGLSVGNYTATVTAAAAGYTGATLNVNLTVSAPVVAQEIKVNFQDPNTTPPAGWVRDYGQPFGLRTGQHQGSGLIYGWKRSSDNSLLDLSVGGSTPGNGRNRGIPADVLLATLMHMQGNHVSGTFNGTAVEGYWEVKVPNGVYDVTVSAGDASVNSDPEIHTINIEGVNAISGFVPSGAAGSLTRFKSATVRVSVTDEQLTINANGGTNTKINSAMIVPVSVDPYLHWSASSQSLVIDKDPAVSDKTFSLDLSKFGSSEETTISLSADYGEGATGWLSFNGTHNSNEPNVTFDYTAAKELALGTYTATVTASAEGYLSANFTVQLTVVEPGSTRPYVISSTPADGETGVVLNPTIAANSLHVPEVPGYKGGVDNSTITSETVKLLKVSGGSTTSILGTVQGTGGGDAISFSPTFALEPNTTYKFVITDGVRSFSGAQFIPYEATFTTGAQSTDPSGPIAVEFKPEAIPGTQGKKYTSVTFGPDGKFYALRLDGTIERFTVNHATGQLSGLQEIRTLVNKYGNRSAVGLTFDPSSTASNLIAWVSHCSSGLDNAPEFDGNLSKVTGSNLETEQLVLTRLPRSKKDHLVNSISFGPDGALYFNQGSNSAMGAYDGTWQRNESLLAGAVLRLDLNKLAGLSLPLNVQTTANQTVINTAPANSITMSDGTYNPYASNSPLTIFASGVRNAYDLVWHSNGHLYVPANGSAAGGASPASVAGTRRPDGSFYSGPAIPATTSIQVQRDWLFRVNPNKPVGYYGHANPLRGEYVTNRGYIDNNKYPSGTAPDANYRGAAFDFEFNKSPNGVLEYKSGAFNGALKGWILVCRFSGGSDIIALKPGTMTPTSDQNNDGIYNIVESRTGSGTNGIPGFGGLSNPLDITEDIQTGNLYVIEYNWNNTAGKATQITLLKATTPSAPSAVVSVSPEQVLDNVVVNATGTNRTVTIANTGNASLSVSGITLEGTHQDQFLLSGAGSLPISVAPNSATTFNVAFKPATTGVKDAAIRISSNGGADKLVRLGGLGTAGLGGSNEPSLQAILDVYGIDINVGDDNPATNIIHSNTEQQKATLLGDEVAIQKFERAVDGPVTIEPLAVFGPQHTGGTVTGFGWYVSGEPNTKNELFTVANGDYQTIRVNANGALSFDPGNASFGFYSRWPFFENRHLYSEDVLNTFGGAIPHHVRVYPLKNADGTLVENAYVVATEEHISGFDFQDIVVIVRNVRPAGQIVVASGNRINAGGPQYVDGQSRTWSADAYFSSSATSSKTFDVQGTADDALYLSYRYATPAAVSTNPGALFSYNIPVETGEYNIKLHFLEPYFGAPGGVAGTTGARVFHVDIEGQRVLNSYDIFATDGAAKAVVKSFDKVAVTDGKLDINFTSVINNAIVSAIEFEKITVETPTAPTLAISPAELIFDGVKNTTIGPKVLTLKNEGSEELTIESITKSGANSGSFTVTGQPTTISGGESATVSVTFQPGSTVGVLEAAVQIASNDPANPAKTIPLSGLSTNGFEGGNEPPLANVVKALGYGINVGWTSLASGMDSYAKGDEALVPLFEKAGAGKVKITPVARYSPAEELPFGWYTNTEGSIGLNQTGALLGGSPHHQTLFPGLASGSNEFDPQDNVFGIYVDSKTFNRKTYTEDDLNAITGSGFNHRVRTYPMKNRAGELIPNSYLICFEDAENGDYQDYVFVVSNVVPVGTRQTLAFSPNILSFEVPEGGTSSAKQLTLSASNGTPGSITLTKSANSNWLLLPSASIGTLSFNINAEGLTPGLYQSTVTATAEGFVNATAEVMLEVTGFSENAIKVNFQLATSATPQGYAADAGLAFDATRGYGWIEPASGQPKDHTLSMRERTGTGEVRLRTLALMQGNTNGQTPGSWEYVLPNGLYKVSVSSGDPDFLDSNHRINVEGVPAIIGFVPTAQQTFKVATITAEVKDGKLTLDANGGTNSKINYVIIDPTTPEEDRTAPVVAVKFKGTAQSPGVYRNEVVVSVEASDAGGSGLSSVHYSLNNGPFVEYFAPVQIKEVGEYAFKVKAVDGNNNETITNAYSFSVIKPVLNNTNMVVENLDKFPAADHLTFSNIQIPWQRTGTPFNENHNKVKVRISNKGAGTLTVNSLTFSNASAWKIAQVNGVDFDATTALPLTVKPGAFVDATVEFIANFSSGRVRVLHDTLFVASNDDLVPHKKVYLHGLWQRQGEGSNEPYVNEIIDAFGFKTRTGFNSSDGASDGNSIIPNSDEILSSFFLRADATKPVYVIQMGAYHGCCSSTETFQWYAKGSTSNSTLFTHNALDGQSLLPRRSGSTTVLAEGTFSPSATTANPTAAFGFKVSSAFSDRARNSEGKIGLRIWKAVDANGNVIPNAYIIGHDYIGSDVTNYDYQDNVFFVSNVKPETGPANFSELASVPSAVDLGSIMVGSTNTASVSLRNLGKTYPDGSSDPTIQIRSVEVAGPNLGDFIVTSPAAMTIAPQAAGNISVAFRPGSRGIKNAALLVHYNNALSPLRVPLYGIADDGCSTLKAVKRIKSAADANVTIAGNSWESDKNYRKGNVQLDKPAATPIAGTEDDVLYQTYLSSTGDLNEIRYEIPIANGNYMVRMHFVENFWTTVGARVFNISLENELRLSNFDIFREVGYKAALVKDFEVAVVDGMLNIKFNPSANRLAIAGLEIFGAAVGENALTVSSKAVVGAACGEPDGSVELAVSNSTATSFLYKLGVNGAYQSTALFENLEAGSYTFYAKEDIANGCEASAVIVVPNRDNNLSFQVSAPPLGCSATGGTATVSNVTGGAGAYTYSWNTVPVQTGSTATNLSPGLYTVTVTDVATGCSKSQDVSIDRAEGCVVTAIRINTGGAAYKAVNGDEFIADQYFTANNSIIYSNTAIPDIANTNDDAMYKTERSSSSDLGSFGYNIPVSNGNHTVKLHFAEIYSTSNSDLGRRVMNVKIEGQTVLSNYDIIAEVGVRTAVIKSFDVSVTDGTLHLEFGATANRPKISAIEVITFTDPVNQVPVANAGGNKEVILPGTSVILSGSGSDPEDGANVTYAWSQISGPNTATIVSANTAQTNITGLSLGSYTFRLTVTDTKGASATSDALVLVKSSTTVTSAIRINAGGAQMTAFGETFSADQYFTGNGKSYVNTQASIAGTTEDALYQSERSTLQNLQSFGYNIPVENGKYLLRLHFAEIYFGATGGGAGGVGKRIFSVTAEGNAIPGLTNYDIIADVGTMTAVVKEVEVDVKDGALSLNFSASVNQPKVSAIEVLGLTAGNQQPTANAGSDQTITLPVDRVTLAGTGSDPEDGANVSFVWSQLSGPNQATIASVATAQTEVTGLIEGTYTFQLEVADKQGAKATSTVKVVVNKAIVSTYNLTVTTVGNGNVTPGSGEYGANQVVSLRATPQEGYAFVGWSGDVTSIDNPLSIAMTSNKSVTATFVPLQLTVNVTAGTGGTVSVSPKKDTYSYNEEIIITATAQSGYEFENWSGDLTGVTNPITIKVTDNLEIAAGFKLKQVNQFSLTTATVGAGTVTRSPDQTSYTTGSTVTLTATPAAGYQFAGWSGDASGAQNPLSLTMDGNKSVTANFELIPTYTLTITQPTGGTISTNPAPNQDGKYRDGTIVTLTALPASGYRFAGWAGDASGTANPLQLVMDANKAVSATFEAISTAGPRVTDFVLVSAHTEQDLMPLADGQVISLASLSSTKLNIRVNTSPATVGSVKFELSGAQSKTYTDNAAPYALHGDDGAGNFYYGNWNPPATGTYTLRATPYSGAKATGTAGTPLTITFTVVQDAAVATVQNTNTVYSSSGRVLNVEVLPNPNEGDMVTVSLENFERNEAVFITVYDAKGRTVKVGKVVTNEQGSSDSEIHFNNKLSHGLYLIVVQSPSAKVTRKLVVE